MFKKSSLFLHAILDEIVVNVLGGRLECAVEDVLEALANPLVGEVAGAAHGLGGGLEDAVVDLVETAMCQHGGAARPKVKVHLACLKNLLLVTVDGVVERSVGVVELVVVLDLRKMLVICFHGRRK